LQPVAKDGIAIAMSLSELFASATFDADAMHATIGPDWLQGRTAYGGASAAIALTAVKAAFPDLPPLRSVQIAFVGPLSGDVNAVPTLLRRGKNSAFIGCDITSVDGVGLRALFLFMASRDSMITYPAPTAPPCAPPGKDIVDTSRLGPGFIERFTLSIAARPTAGFLRWARLKDREGLDPETELVAIADALPPAAMALATQWGPISTTAWQLNMLTDTPQTDDGWWLLEAVTTHAEHGSSSQTMTIWNRNGYPVATATQSVALFI
jgi:hypothetical protein